MKYIMTVIIFLSLAQYAFSEDLPPVIYAEYYACEYDEGKTERQMSKWITRWNAWMDSTDLDEYGAVLLKPLFRSPSSGIDLMWVGHTPSNYELARGLSAFNATNQRQYWPAKKCSINMLARQYSMGNLSVSDLDPNEFVVGYWFCKFNKEATIKDAYFAQKKIVDTANVAGRKLSSRIIMPRQGVPADLKEYDFALAYIHENMEEWGANVDDHFSSTRNTENQKKADEIFSCDNSVVYTGKVIRN